MALGDMYHMRNGTLIIAHNHARHAWMEARFGELDRIVKDNQDLFTSEVVMAVEYSLFELRRDSAAMDSLQTLRWEYDYWHDIERGTPPSIIKQDINMDSIVNYRAAGPLLLPTETMLTTQGFPLGIYDYNGVVALSWSIAQCRDEMRRVTAHGRASQRAMSPYTSILSNTDIVLTQLLVLARYMGIATRARSDTVGRPDDPMVMEHLREKGARQREMSGVELLRPQPGRHGGH